MPSLGALSVEDCLVAQIGSEYYYGLVDVQPGMQRQELSLAADNIKRRYETNRIKCMSGGIPKDVRLNPKKLLFVFPYKFFFVEDN